MEHMGWIPSNKNTVGLFSLISSDFHSIQGKPRETKAPTCPGHLQGVVGTIKVTVPTGIVKLTAWMLAH